MEPVPDGVRWPPQTGRLSAGQAARLEAALAAPCRAWEPGVWPLYPRLRGHGAPRDTLPQDWRPILVQLQEAGRPVRSISAPLNQDSHAGLASIAHSPSP
jgi:hypothetical protein